MYECHCFWVAFLVPPKMSLVAFSNAFRTFGTNFCLFWKTKKFGRASEPFSKNFKALQSKAFVARDQMRGFVFARANGSIKQLETN